MYRGISRVPITSCTPCHNSYLSPLRKGRQVALKSTHMNLLPLTLGIARPITVTTTALSFRLFRGRP
jgi:hypothetical protein